MGSGGERDDRRDHTPQPKANARGLRQWSPEDQGKGRNTGSFGRFPKLGNRRFYFASLSFRSQAPEDIDNGPQNEGAPKKEVSKHWGNARPLGLCFSLIYKPALIDPPLRL